eukprot:10950500-Alexandrium_andersonii.AAC.1
MCIRDRLLMACASDSGRCVVQNGTATTTRSPESARACLHVRVRACVHPCVITVASGMHMAHKTVRMNACMSVRVKDSMTAGVPAIMKA